MRYFTVTVYQMRVQVDETPAAFTNHDASAGVDGDIWRYKIKRSPNLPKNDRHWRDRAWHNIHYHAHNSGTVVRFEPTYAQRRRKPKIHEKQLSFW